MTKYVKTVPIEAEQFDGSDEMVNRLLSADYVVANAGVDDETDSGLLIGTREGYLELKKGSWIATGINGEHWPIADDVFQKTYAELPVIPKAVADTIEQVRKINGYELGNLFFDAMEFDNPGNCADWIASHQDEIARAWLDEYQVEEDE